MERLNTLNDPEFNLTVKLLIVFAKDNIFNDNDIFTRLNYYLLKSK